MPTSYTTTWDLTTEPAEAGETTPPPAPSEEPEPSSEPAATGTDKPKRKPPACRPPAEFQSDEVAANAYKLNCQICRTVMPGEIARDYGLSTDNPLEIALAYAEADYQDPYLQAAFEGCAKGFKL